MEKESIREEVANNEDIEANIEDSEISTSKSAKRRRKFDIISQDREKYTKRPRLIESMLPPDTLSHLSNTNIKSVQHIDFAWMLSHYLKVPYTPMWVGFNSLLYDDTAAKQIICYLTTINASPTNRDVVLETMVQSKKVASECGQDFIEVTYDLAIAKIALQIQSTEKGLFDNLFIHLGVFHIMMAYIKAVGKFIDNCGLTIIMVNTEIVANGSVNGFITGKSFNRCKRLHPVITLALKMLHFERFVRQEEVDLSNELNTALLQFLKSK